MEARKIEIAAFERAERIDRETREVALGMPPGFLLPTPSYLNPTVYKPARPEWLFTDYRFDTAEKAKDWLRRFLRSEERRAELPETHPRSTRA